MAENTVVRLTRESMDPRKFSKRFILFSFLVSPPMVGLFRVVSENPHPWAPTAAYAVLWLWFLAEVIFLWWSQEIDLVKKLISPSGWYLRDVPLQLLTGMSLFGFTILALMALGVGSLRTPDLFLAISLIGFFWFVSAPAETALQAWLWPMSLPFGPIVAQIAFVLLHGERAYDPAFFIAAFALGFAFWILSFLRYLNWRGSRWFGPVAAWSAHATWNSLLIWVALAWPQV